MAPAPPARRPLTLKAAEKKRPGPAPKPLVEGLRTSPAKQIRRVERSYSRERKIEVLLYLLNHRVPDARPRRVPRRRIGQPHEQELTQPMVRTETGEYVWYRAPTYAEASNFWKIPTPTIQGWWDSREKLLKGTGIEVPTVGPGGLSAELAAAGASTVPNPHREPPPGREEAPRKESPMLSPGEARRLEASAAGSENGRPPAGWPIHAPSPNPLQDPPAPAETSSPAGPGAPSTAANGTQSPQDTQLASAVAGQQSHAVSGAQPLATPASQPPSATAVRSAPNPPQGPLIPLEPAPIRADGPPILHAAPAPQSTHPPPAPHVAQCPSPLPPAYDPAHYFVVYTGPHPGPFPGQHCLPPGTVLPVVYAGQPPRLGPLSYVAVFPTPPADANLAPSPTAPAAQTQPSDPPLHGRPPVHGSPHHPPHSGQHAPPGPHGECPLPHHGQPPVPHGPQPPPADADQRPNHLGAHPLNPRQASEPHVAPPPGPLAPNGVHVSPAGYVGPYAPPNLAAAQLPHLHSVPPVHVGPPPFTTEAQTSPAPASFGSPPTPITNTAQVQATRAAGPSPPGPERQLIVTPPGEQQSQAGLLSSPAGPDRPAAAEPAAAPGLPVNAAAPATTVDETLGREGERTDTSTPPVREPPASDRALSGPECRSQDPGASPISGRGVSRAGIKGREPAASASAPGTPQAAAVTPMETDTDGWTGASLDTPMEIDTEVTTEPAAEPPGRAAALCATAPEDPAEPPTVLRPTPKP